MILKHNKNAAEIFSVEDSHGFTLIELLIGIVLSAIVLLVVVNLFIWTNELNTIQEKVAGTQQDIRVAMEIMTRDIRMAGLNPSGSTTIDAGFVDNSSEITDTDADSIAVRYDYDGDGVCEINRSYYYDNANNRLMYWDGSVYQPLTDDGTVQSMSFSYTLSDGTNDNDPTANSNLGSIRVVTISICGQITGVYAAKYNRTHCFTNVVRARNM